VVMTLRMMAKTLRRVTRMKCMPHLILLWIREYDAFLGHEMRGPAGTGRGGVSTAGGWEGQGARKGNGVRGHRLPSPPYFVQNLLKYFGFLSR